MQCIRRAEILSRFSEEHLRFEPGPADHEMTCQNFEHEMDPQIWVFSKCFLAFFTNKKPALVIHQRGFPSLIARTSDSCRCTALEVGTHHVIFRHVVGLELLVDSLQEI